MDSSFNPVCPLIYVSSNATYICPRRYKFESERNSIRWHVSDTSMLQMGEDYFLKRSTTNCEPHQSFATKLIGKHRSNKVSLWNQRQVGRQGLTVPLIVKPFIF